MRTNGFQDWLRGTRKIRKKIKKEKREAMATLHPENNRVHSVAVETEGLLLQLDEHKSGCLGRCYTLS